MGRFFTFFKIFKIFLMKDFLNRLLEGLSLKKQKDLPFLLGLTNKNGRTRVPLLLGVLYVGA